MKCCTSWLRTCAAIASLCLLCLLAAPAAMAQYTTVTTTHLGGSPGVANAILYVQPVTGCSGGIGAARIGSSGGQISGVPYQAIVTGGAASVSVPDALATVPNIAYAMTVVDPTSGDVLIGYGLQADGIHVNTGGPYGCVQPTGSSWSFDSYVPSTPVTVLPATLFDSPSASTGSPVAASVASVGGGQYHLSFTIPAGPAGIGSDANCGANGSGTLKCIGVTASGLWGKYSTYDAFGMSIVASCCSYTGTVTNVSLASNVATVTTTRDSGHPAPVVGQTISISGTSADGGIFNVTNVPITATSYGLASTTGTISFALTAANFASTASSGTIIEPSYVTGIGYALGITPTNHGVSGSSAADGASVVYAQSVPSSGSPLYSIHYGTNDLSASTGGSNQSAYLSYYESTMEAETIFLLTPDAYKTKASNAFVTSGWATSNLKDPWAGGSDLNGGVVWPFQMQSSTAGSILSAQAFGSTINIGYTMTTATTGQAQVVVDGAAVGTINFQAPFTGSLALPLTVSGCTASGTAPNRNINCTYTGSPAVNAGDVIVNQGMSDVTYNGQFFVTSVGSGTYTAVNNLAVGSSSSGGTAGLNQEKMSFCNSGSPFCRTFAPQVLQIANLSPGAHKVDVMMKNGGAGNVGYIDYISGNEGWSKFNGPTLAYLGTTRGLSAFAGDPLTSTWEQGDRAAANLLIGEGYAVNWVSDRGAVGNIPGGYIQDYMYAESTPTCTFTSGSNVLTACDSVTGFSAGQPVWDSQVKIPAGAVVSSTTMGPNTITMGMPVASVAINTAGSGMTDTTYSTKDSSGGGCTTNARMAYTVSGGALISATILPSFPGVGCTSAPAFTLTGGTPGTVTATLATVGASGSETFKVFTTGVHPNGSGHKQIADSALNALTVARPPNQQAAPGAAAAQPVVASSLAVTGSTCSVFGVTACPASSDIADFVNNGLDGQVKIINNSGAAYLKVQPSNNFGGFEIVGTGETWGLETQGANDLIIYNANLGHYTAKFFAANDAVTLRGQVTESALLSAPCIGTDSSGNHISVSCATATARTAYSSCSGAFTSSTTIAFNGFGSTSGACTGSASGGLGMVMQSAGTLSRLTVRCATHGVGTAGQDTVTIWDAPSGGSAAATALTLAYDSTVTGNSTVQDLTHTVSYAVGDIISVRVVTQATETLATCTASFSY